MKKLLLVIFTFCFLNASNAQQFSFQMTFDDGNGGRDSITLGYDPGASDTIDASFGEANVSSTFGFPLPSFAASNIWWTQNYPPFANQTGFETKTQIVKGSCGANLRIEIDILSRYWPVTAHWNSALFQDSCRNGSVFTSVTPFGWWDSTGFRVILASRDSFSFSSQENYCCASLSVDTVSVFWIGLGDSTLLSSVNDIENDDQELWIFPNPSSEKSILQFSLKEKSKVEIEILDETGRKIKSFSPKPIIGLNRVEMNLENIAKGIYFVRIKSDSFSSMKKLIVN